MMTLIGDRSVMEEVVCILLEFLAIAVTAAFLILHKCWETNELQLVELTYHYSSSFLSSVLSHSLKM